MQVGTYQVVEELGRGGMGVVYRAVDQRTGREVALKHIQAGSWADEPGRLAARLGRELEALSRLDHPGIVSAHDAGWVSGRFFVAMELVEG
ncbi:MAG TPA: serine/threonine protein kinase, partial [Planctomycetes bacterium]|nr:serine/threonine protein kinase [Planctomycetota bacterium]